MKNPRSTVPAIDAFWDKVDDVFGDALERPDIPGATIVAAAMQAACFASFELHVTEEEFLEMARMAWARSLLDYRTFVAEMAAEQGKAAKA